jgi:siroheme synthase-like protein
VGFGEELELRARSLMAMGAELLIVATEANEVVRGFAQHANVKLELREFTETDLDGKWLALLVGRDANVAARIAHAAEERRVFFCAIDLPEHSSFSHMALAHAGSLTVAISTRGEAPSLGRRLREEIARLLQEANIANFVAQLADLRRRTPPEKRREVLGAAVKELHFTGKIEIPSIVKS